MPNNRDNIELRSDEVQEILGHVPNWMIRWGITLFFALILSFIFLAWVIKYPDVISGEVIITTEEPPIRLVTKTTGEIDQLWFKDNTVVKKNQVVAVVLSTMDINSQTFLHKEITLIGTLSKQNKLAEYKKTDFNGTFGELQFLYSSLQSNLDNYKRLILESDVPFNMNNLSKQINNQKALLTITLKELKTAESILKNAENKFRSDKTLFEKGVISQFEFFNREKEYQRSISEIQSLEKSKIQINITLTDLEKQLNDLRYNYTKEQNVLLQAIEGDLGALGNALSSWKQSYELIAPINGTLTYLENIHENQFVESGKSMFAVIPENQQYIANLRIPKGGYGKIKVEQKVMLKLDNFPYHEYGQLEGKITKVGIISNENFYAVEVSLSNGLISTYKKEFVYSPEMSGTAEIITEDLRITDRIFNKFKRIFE
jgi:multidrug efflux pump subunit AcrA (membrane-fusion protein)